MRSKKFLRAEQAALVWDVPGLVAGVDEAGRGPLAGPVVAAAVILDDHKPIKGLADSKKLTARRRENLFDEIRAKALCCSVAQASVEEIDKLNILQATMLAMQRAVQALSLVPDLQTGCRGIPERPDLFRCTCREEPAVVHTVG